MDDLPSPGRGLPKLSRVAEDVGSYGIDIYVGGMEGASDLSLLRAHGITTVVNCAVNLDINWVSAPLSAADQPIAYGFGDVRYHKLGLIDGAGNPETMVLAGYFLLKGAIEQRLPEKPNYPRREYGNVLVNCRGGRSRSVMLVSLFLACAEPGRFASLDAALAHVRARRELRAEEWHEAPNPVLVEAARRAKRWIEAIEGEKGPR